MRATDDHETRAKERGRHYDPGPGPEYIAQRVVRRMEVRSS